MLKPILSLLLLAFPTSPLFGADNPEYRLLATSKTSTMQKELNAAAAEGFRFETVMGGDTAGAGAEVVTIMVRERKGSQNRRFDYRLLATNKTSTMDKELRQNGSEGYLYCGQTVFESAFGGQEVVVILEKDLEDPAAAIDYRLLATSRTSTMQKELSEAADEGYRLAGLTVGKTQFGGNELVSILFRRVTR